MSAVVVVIVKIVVVFLFKGTLDDEGPFCFCMKREIEARHAF